MTLSVVERVNRPATDWHFPKPFGWRTVLAVVVALALLVITGHRVEMDRAAMLTGQAIASAVGAGGRSQVAIGLSSVVTKLFPLQIDARTDVDRVENFDPDHLPFLAHVETEETRAQTLNPQTFKLDTVVQRKQVLVRRFGYVLTVLWKLVETIEIALWGTVLAILVGFPLAYLSARNLVSSRWINFAGRAAVSLFRAVPELISALFLVLAYGFGPIAGVLALGIHSTGFLGKFYADDIENTDPKAQEALQAIGANKLKVFRFAIL
ncbi:MAG TPA: ABC transporter permease subunit, partial [Rhizomicrobium sp.]|nr:ABC transporter permease subunit [Rhizomicrobium sp.]